MDATTAPTTQVATVKLLIGGHFVESKTTEWRDVVNQLRRRHPNYASVVCASTLTFAEISSLWSEKRTGVVSVG